MARDIPPEIQGWNWGAFLLGPIWAIGNRVFLGLLGCLPAIAFCMSFIVGLIVGPGSFLFPVPVTIMLLIYGLPAYVWVAIYVLGMIVLGCKGNEWAWAKRSWESIEKFKRRQRAWAIASFFLGTPVTFLNIRVVKFLHWFLEGILSGM